VSIWAGSGHRFIKFVERGGGGREGDFKLERMVNREKVFCRGKAGSVRVGSMDLLPDKWGKKGGKEILCWGGSNVLCDRQSPRGG